MLRWPSGSGEMAGRIRDFDGPAHGLAPVTAWPQSLRGCIELMLAAHAEIVLFWGPDYRAFYNDAYRPTIGDKHPHALGRPAIEHWGELWDDLEPLLAGVRRSGETFSARDRPFQINRNGFLEPVWFDISYSAVRDESGEVAGVFCIVSETTARVLAGQALAASEAALRQEKEFTRLLLDSTSDAFYAVDRDGATTLCNAAFLAMLGYGSGEQVLGRKLHGEIMHSNADGTPCAPPQSPILQAAQRGTSARRDGALFFRRDGSRLLLDYRVEPIRRHGELVGAVCVLTDSRARLLGQELKAARLKAESELQETHDQLRLAEVAGGVGLFLLDIESNLITASAEFCRLFGLPPLASFPASQVEQLFLPETLEVASTPGNRRSGEAPLHVEYRIRRAGDGELRWISRRAEFVRDTGGRPVGMRGVVQDVTERKLAEASLKDSESRLRVLAQTLPNQVWTADARGKLDWLNQRVYDYSGSSEAQLLGDGWALLVHPVDLPRVAAEWQRSLELGLRYETEFRIRRGDGVYRWHLVRALPIDSDGERRWLGTNTDIEDQKSLQEGLSELNVSLEQRIEQRTRDRDRIWRLSTDLIVVSDFDNRIMAANPAWEKLLGWTEAELIGRWFMELVHPDDRDISQAESGKLASGRITQRFENRLRHRDGSYRTISWIAVPDDGRIHGVGRDISAERDAARTLHETEERLRQSQKMEALGQLTGGIAHDFNNLLQGISGSIDVVRRRLAAGRGEDVGRFMDSATQSAQRAAGLIHRLLAFARRQSLDSKPVNLSDLAGSLGELLRRTLGEQIVLEVLPGENVWLVQSDESQLESAILNLAINARDAMPRGGKLTITTANATLDESYTRDHEGLAPGDYALLAVTDTGSGMSAEVLARVFEPFFTTKPIGQGTGLGLSMIYGFAKQSGGHVRITSEPGEGTTVQLYLPRHGTFVPDAPSADESASAAGIAPAEGETVLVIEDDPAVRLIVLDELGELGYTTIEAIDGPSAMPVLVSARKIDLLLSDVGLPGMNGRQIAEIARQHRPGLRVLFMTGYAENAAARAEFLAPGMEMISKPFAMDDLAARIRAMLDAPATPARD